jgi:hypothetical protein
MRQQQRAALGERGGMQEEFVEVDAMLRLNSSKTSISDPFGLRRETAFGNSLVDAVSFHFPSQWSRDVHCKKKQKVSLVPLV